MKKEASEGYEVDENIYEAQVIPENSEQEIIVKKIVSKEKKIRGDLELKKTGKKETILYVWKAQSLQSQ